MPKIAFKEDTLNGAASIIKYAHRDCYYLRVRRDGKKYSNISLDTEDIDIARKNSIDSYMSIINKPAKRRTNKQSFLKACEDYLEYKQQQAKRKQITIGTVSTYEQRVYQRIIPFAKSSNIKTIGQIEPKSFSNYANYYLDVTTKGKWASKAEGLTPSTINSDISTLKEILKWLIGEERLEPINLDLIKRAKDRTNYNEDANPAFVQHEWEKMKDILYTWDKKLPIRYNRKRAIDDEADVWKRRWFINYIRFQFNSGNRPHESAKIRIGDCRTTDKIVDGKSRKYGIVYIRPDTKRGKRDMIMNGYTLLKVQQHLKKGIKIRNEQIKLDNKKIREEYMNRNIDWLAKKYSDIDLDTRQIPELKQASKDDLLLMNPFCTGKRIRCMYHTEMIRKWWNQIIEKANLDSRYTLYSLRSTHITFKLYQGTPIKFIADNCGTSQAEIERTYQRIRNTQNMEELAFFKDNASKEDELILKPLIALT
jgi:hypothetical protein